MARNRLWRLAVVSVSFYIFISLIFHTNISKTTLPLKPYTRQTQLLEDVKGINASRNATVSIQNRSVLLDFRNSSQLNVVSSQTVSKSFINFTLPKFNKNRPIVFLHIGKNGGTSFDASVKPIIGKLQGRYIGNKHFDWSYIETIPKADVVVLLREPVSRAVSHYYFMRKWSKNKLNQGPLSTYVNNPEEMLQTRDCWQDGQASVAWLTGTHIANWAGIKKDQVPSRERLSLNISDMCLLAAKRLESTFWFGIIEDPDRSFELLQYQLGWPQKLSFRKSNVNKHPEATENITRIFTSLMPQDIWLYEYAKLLFEARWTFYKTGIYKSPDMPPLPTLESVPCISTRAVVLCKNGPLSPLYYVRSDAPLEEKRLPDDILNKLKLGDSFILDRNISMP